jgi:hypothetical protein
VCHGRKKKITKKMVNDREIKRTLSQCIIETPIIDNHAHPLLGPSALQK